MIAGTKSRGRVEAMGRKKVGAEGGSTTFLRVSVQG